MQENIPLTIERLSDEQEKEFRISSTLQIRSILREISEKGALAALYYDGAKRFIMTSVLGVGEKGVWVERGQDEPENLRIAESKRITFVSSQNQVKVQFAVTDIRAVTHQGYPSFYLPFPANLYRLQHREYFRLMLSLSEHLVCSVPIGKPQAGEHKDVPIMDISGGGLRLFCADGEFDFVQGETYTGCRVNLPETGKIEVSLTVKNVVSVSPKPGQVIHRVGCEFGKLDAASSILLQRYITNVQRVRAAA